MHPLYPVPAKDNITIKFNKIQNTDYHLTTLFGQVILKGHLNSDKFEIDISEFPQGIYFLTIGNNNIKILKAE